MDEENGMEWVEGFTGLPDGEDGIILVDSLTCPVCGLQYAPEVVEDSGGRCPCGFRGRPPGPPPT